MNGVKLQEEMHGFLKVKKFTSWESWRAEKGPGLEIISLYYICPKEVTIHISHLF